MLDMQKLSSNKFNGGEMTESGTQIPKVAVIMAGGSGLRLWPRSTERKPKQFVHMIGEGTMIQNTWDRLCKFYPPEDVYVVTSSDSVPYLQEQLDGIPAENIIPEPFARNTAPCLLLSEVILSNKYSPETVMAAFPSDHMIFNQGEFFDSLDTGIKAAYELKGIITIGVQPTRPETGFGYIQYRKDYSEGIESLFNAGVRYSSTFAEKPDSETAKRFIESADFLWNSGIFISRLDVFRKSAEEYIPEDNAAFDVLRDHAGKDTFWDNVQITYRQITSLSIDYAILEKADNVYTVKSTFRWSDVGNWDEIYRLSMKDARNNVISGDVISVNSSNCLVISDGKLIGLAGVNDLIVIDSNDALLICRRNNSDDVMEIVDFLRRKQINRFL